MEFSAVLSSVSLTLQAWEEGVMESRKECVLTTCTSILSSSCSYYSQFYKTSLSTSLASCTSHHTKMETTNTLSASWLGILKNISLFKFKFLKILSMKKHKTILRLNCKRKTKNHSARFNIFS